MMTPVVSPAVSPASPPAATTTPVATPTAAPVTSETKAPPTASATSAAGNSLPSADDPTGNNLLTNGGFETGDFTGWTTGGNFEATGTVTATDGTDPVSTTFAWNVSSFTLDNPGDQNNAEGDAVVLQATVEATGNPTLTFSATGLPNGLSINPNTGLIAGTLANLDSNSSPYSVTISATDGTSTSNQTFTWTVANQAVTVTNPGTQSNAEGDSVSVPINATDPTGNPLSFTATGLPAGLEIDYASGIISGTIDSSAAETNGGVYQVTVLADDGQGNNGSVSFTWNVSHVNQLPDDVDIQAWVDGSLAGDQVMTNTAVSFGTNGASGSSDTPSEMAAALAPNAAVANFGNDGHITNKDTPKGMADRIPPRVATPVTWSLSEDLGKGEELWLVIKGDAHKDENYLDPRDRPIHDVWRERFHDFINGNGEFTVRGKLKFVVK